MSTERTPPEPPATAGQPTRTGGAGSKLRGLLLVIACFPLLAALILNAQADFDPYGKWIGSLGLVVDAVFVTVVWIVTEKKQQ
jgi:hypothetical protein